MPFSKLALYRRGVIPLVAEDTLQSVIAAQLCLNITLERGAAESGA